MKSKKICASIITTIIFIFMIMTQTISSFAATGIELPVTLGLIELRGNPAIGYAIDNPTAGGERVWNIVKYVDDKNYEEINAYCVKAGVGFRTTEKKSVYNKSYNLKNDIATIQTVNNNNEYLKELVNSSYLNHILWIFDNMYLPGVSTQEERNELLERAGILPEESVLTDEDIEVAQQAVVWYFTNYKVGNDELYNKLDKTPAWIWYAKDQGLNYANASTSEQSIQIDELYKYMIEAANNNADKYDANYNLSAPVQCTTTTLGLEQNGNTYIAGPINIEKINNDMSYTIDGLTVTDGNNNNISYKLAIKSGEEYIEISGMTLKDIVEKYNSDQNRFSAYKDIYLSIQQSEVETLKIGFNINYKVSAPIVYISSSNSEDQPVVVPDREKKTVPVKLEVTKAPKKEFDLALRKYITKVNGVELTNASSRVPTIVESTLQTGTTATYKHKKDPVIVETGSKVTYKLTIYNEGEKIGRATKVVDQLPTGLHFDKIVSGNFENESYNETTNTLTLTRKAENVENLNAYVTGNLDSETIEIECTVTQKPDTENKRILTNVAWISEAYDAEDGVKIINQEGLDRDSEPSNYPTKTANELNTIDNGYTGNGNKTDLTDSTYYYKGQQDDDDFEKLVIMPKTFDLKLIKRITQVNSQNVPERIQSIDVSNLNRVDANGNIIATTAQYNLNKEPIGVKKGDIVTYTFRVYNEGDLDGYASQITEDIPEGLEFIWSEKTGDELKNDTKLTEEEKVAVEFNQTYLWGNFKYDSNRQKIIEISTDYLSKENEGTPGSNMIHAFGSNDGSKTANDLSYKEVSVMLKVVSENVGGTIIRNEAAITKDTDADGEEINDRDSSTDNWVKYEDDEDFDNIKLQSFDLALRKFIIAVSSDDKIENKDYLKNSDGSYTRAPIVDTSKLNTKDENDKLITTAIYNHPKDPVVVKKGDTVVYMLRVYNEGDISGYASQIKDHLPLYLEFVEGEFNTNYGWTVSEDGRTVTTNYLDNQLINKITTSQDDKIILSYKEVPIMCKVTEQAKTGENITNIADITEYRDDSKEEIIDRDSQKDNVILPEDKDLPSYKDDEKQNYVPGQQDDDDFEKVVIRKFDLALRKFITAINEENVTTRIPNVKYENGKISYVHPKNPLEVAHSDIVTYTIRVYNEGEVDGYAKEITDDIPAGLEFLPENEINKTYRWVMLDKDGNETQDVEKAVKITTDYLSKEQEENEYDNLLEAFNPSEEISNTNPSYKDVKVEFKVTEPNSSDKIIINSAQISDDSDKNGDEIDDEDSIPDVWNEGEDDQDKEYIKLKDFDLALRKFITSIGEKEVTTRIPEVKYENGKISYVHPKDPLDVVYSDIVTYTIRVYNEGEVDGYAKEITDDIPAGLEFLPENEINKTYRWVMLDKDENETQDVEKAVKISTDYLSKEQEENEYDNLLEAFNPSEEINDTNPHFKDVKVSFKVVEPNTSDKIIINSAQISDDSDKNGDEVDDIDSIPDEWNEGEDDQDKEYIKLNYFDLALRKWVTQAIVIENGKETITQTGHTPEMDPEPIVKVDLHRKKLDQVTVKFRYSIRITNEGDIAGYAKEITDYVPEGLKFVAQDNPGWTDEGNNVISTRLLENKLLQPGEYADVEVLLTWINNKDNIGLKTNTAEISEDYNDKNVPDIDSTPDNQVPGEDDIDDAPVILSVATGQTRIYFALGFGILVTIATGIVLIKKFVL